MMDNKKQQKSHWETVLDIAIKNGLNFWEKVIMYDRLVKKESAYHRSL